MFLPPDVLDWPLNVVVVRSGGRTILIDAGLGVEFPDLGPTTGGRRHRYRTVTDVVLHAHGPRWRAARRRVETGCVRTCGFTWRPPRPSSGTDFSRASKRPPIPDVLRRTAKRFLNEYPQPATAVRGGVREAPGVVVRRTGGHTPGHSVVRLASGSDRLTFVGDLVLAVGFDYPDWHNGFEHDPEEAARVRVRVLRELAATGEPLGATHLSFPSVRRVAVAGDVFRVQRSKSLNSLVAEEGEATGRKCSH
jgi:glyoxylase-like metal-dependent hydrolase (beta-lactamase superfamily II)